MEPMALGSAPSSPSSPTANPNYLPAFLIGDNQTTSNTPLSTEVRKNESFNLTPSDRSNFRQKLFSPVFTESMQSPSTAYTSSENKPGPPRQSLFDTIDIKRTVDSAVSDLSKSKTTKDVINSSRNLDSSLRNESPFDKNNSLRIINQHQWITVFGFPPSAASVVLARFAHYGTIVDKRFPAQGNWIHIKFNSAAEASKALCLNGKLISNNIMIGVSLYENKESDKENKDASICRTPVKVRSLRHSYVSPQNSNTVITPEGVPQKSTGIVTKAMEYVFGW